jgi:hypothetical protein
MATIPAYSINGFTRPELILDGFGNIVLDDTASAFVQTYGLRALYIGCPPSTPYPPVLPSLLFPTDTNGAPDTVAEGAAANTTVGITAHATSILGFPVTYSLTADSSGGGFQINPTTGVVSVAVPSRIDFESSLATALPCEPMTAFSPRPGLLRSVCRMSRRRHRRTPMPPPTP